MSLDPIVSRRIQRTLGVLWLLAFIAGPCFWLWEFLNKIAPAYDGFHALLSLLCLYGAVASFFLIRGANWARVSLGMIALILAVGVFWGEILPQGWMRVDKLGDDGVFLLSLMTVVLLFFVIPRGTCRARFSQQAPPEKTSGPTHSRPTTCGPK
jgi:hypothetical protein